MNTTLEKASVLDPTESVPRPEYPRPQFVREAWLNLNGPWNFRIDDGNVGLDEKWFEKNLDFPLTIQVPFASECSLSGIGDRGFHPCVWYRRRFTIPPGWEGKRILLNFGAVDYRATVWVNGTIVAVHEGGHAPFSADITGQVLANLENTVTVRAEDPPTDRYIPRGKQYWHEESAGIFYARTTGIWQTVWLEPVNRSYLEHVRITARTDGSVSFEARVAYPQRFQYVTADIYWDGQPVATATGVVEGPRAVLDARVLNPKLWSPEAPNLYDVTLILHSDREPLDRVEAYFGVRSIATSGGRVMLNDHPLYLRTVLDQGYWPDSNLTPPNDEAIVADIKAALDLGFNGVRKHQKAEDPRYLYWADRMGLLVSAEMANAYLYDHEAVARITREWIELISRDYNHPSIVIWVPINESWGVPNLSDPIQQAHLRALYYLTKSLDDTRLVIDNDGWEHTEATDLFAIHDYAPTGDEFRRRYREIGAEGIPLPLFGKMYLAPGHRYNGSPIFLSEFGGIGYILPEDKRKAVLGMWGYSGIEETAEAALTRMRSLFEAIASIPEIAGVCYTQLYDVEREVNGLLTYDRRTKFPPAAVRKTVELLTGKDESADRPQTDSAGRKLLFKSFMMAGFECSNHILRDGKRLDMVAATDHDRFVAQDYDALAAFGIHTVREGIRWPLIEKADGSMNFDSVLPFLRAARERGIEILWDLMHFGWPAQLDVFTHEWIEHYERLVTGFAKVLQSEWSERAWVAPVNEVSFLAWAGGDTAYLNPFCKGRGHELKRQLARAFIRGVAAVREILPDARMVSPEPVIHIAGRPHIPGDAEEAEAYRMSMFEAWDMALGRVHQDLGGSEKNIDVIGVNFYDRNEWWNFGDTIPRSNPSYRPFRYILEEVYKRYDRPMFVSETGTEDDERPAWLAYVAGEVRAATRAGVPMQGICLYPILNHPGWDDDRHCHNGLFDYATDMGRREVYRPLANEIFRQEQIRLREKNSNETKAF